MIIMKIFLQLIIIKVTLSRNRSLTVKTINYKKFFKLLIVGCISIIALVLLIDTFKSSIKFFIPNIDFT